MSKELIEEHRKIDSEFIEASHKLLVKNRGIIVLEPMNSEKRKLIHDMVDKYSDMVSYKSACLKLSVAMVNMALNKNGIKCLATRDTKFFNNSNPQIPFMGVTKVYILDEDFKLSLPLGLNNSVKEEIDNLSQTIEKDFEDVLIKIGLF